MVLETKRLVLSPWTIADAESLYEYARDPDVGPAAGWPPHESAEESRKIIPRALSGAECYAICEKGSDRPIGSIELMLNGRARETDRDDECELGYWVGKPFWGRGYMPEAAEALMRRGFEDLGMNAIWCAYYEGNEKSRRVQEKLGFTYHHTCENAPVALLHETRICHVNRMTRKQWQKTHQNCT